MKIMRNKSSASYYIASLIIGLLSFNKAFCQSLTNAQLAFLKINTKTIVRDSLQRQPDWNYISPYLKDKKIILIGEPNHGSKEIFELRNSLIKYLHKETG